MSEFFMSGPEEGDVIDQQVFVCAPDGTEILQVLDVGTLEEDKEFGRLVARLLNDDAQNKRERLRNAFRDSFITATSGDGFVIKASFPDLVTMQVAHNALSEALAPTNQAETIVRAANMHHGVIYDVPQPGRHGNVIRMISDLGLCSPSDPVVDEGGFLTSTGRYVDRREAWQIAEKVGQLLERAPTDKRGGFLYSEDVW
ncbi:hypothetical protein [Aureimonas sp. AU40]|uniref:hypothetical protein n=1 Tax=Aureimonas sp. AU40 TaxID=1637747 RepID=UPI00078062EE|nr:hypothetical protein [Aureimonas sp. AU40]